MNKSTRKALSLFLLLILGGQFVYAQWSYGDPVFLDDGGDGCEIAVEEVEVEADCTDPFFKDIEVKAEAKNQHMNDIHEPIPAPTYEAYPESGDPEFPMHVIFDQPVDVDVPTQELPKVEAYNKKIQEEKKIAPIAIQKKVITEPVAEVAEIIPEKEVKIKAEIEEKIVVPDTSTKTISNNSVWEWYTVSKYIPTYRPLILRVLELWETPTEHASAWIINTIPTTISLAYVFEHHLREMMFISFIIFLLFSLMFI